MGLLPQEKVMRTSKEEISKVIIFNNGGEYVKSEFIQYYEDEGIHRKHSIPYTPQHNGVVERKHISLKEMATCMMDSKPFPPNFSAETIKYASYIWNRVPHKYIYRISPL